MQVDFELDGKEVDPPDKPLSCHPLISGGLSGAAQSWSWVTYSKPNPTENFWTQPNPQKSSPDPSQHIIETWYGILGYTENFIQQLLHVTDKFTVNESYYSAAVLINRQQSIS